MKTVQSSYLHLFNILLNWVEFLSRVIESSFSIQSECLNSTSQLDSTLFQKNFNSTQHFLSWILDLNLNTWLDAISLLLTLYSIAWWTELNQQLMIWFKIDTRLSHNVWFKYSNWIKMLIWKFNSMINLHINIKLWLYSFAFNHWLLTITD